MYKRRVFFVSARNALKARKVSENFIINDKGEAYKESYVDFNLLEESGILELERQIEKFLASPAKFQSILDSIIRQIIPIFRESIHDIHRKNAFVNMSLSGLESQHRKNLTRSETLAELINDINNFSSSLSPLFYPSFSSGVFGNKSKQKMYSDLLQQIIEENNQKRDSIVNEINKVIKEKDRLASIENRIFNAFEEIYSIINNQKLNHQEIEEKLNIEKIS